MSRATSLSLPKSEYKGISWVLRDKKWRSTVCYQGITHQCGFYDNELDAVKARDRVIMKLGLEVKLQIFKPIKQT